MITLVLVDRDLAVLKAAEEIGWHRAINVSDHPVNISNLHLAPGTALVAPGTSLGLRSHGIDASIVERFVGIKQKVKQAIDALGHKTTDGRAYCPIGKAVSVPTDMTKNVSIILAPVMWEEPFSLSEKCTTNNPYHAMYAALTEASRIGIHTLYVTCMGKGLGGMTAQQAIIIMKQAHEDFLESKMPRWSLREIVTQQPKLYPTNEAFKNAKLEIHDSFMCHDGLSDNKKKNDKIDLVQKMLETAIALLDEIRSAA